MKKLVRVIFEYEDGTKEILEGKKLEEWIKRINSALVVSLAHGFIEDVKEESIPSRMAFSLNCSE